MPTKIQWTDESWNPVVGCSKVSAGCQNCYAERMAKRLNAMGQDVYGYVSDWNGRIVLRKGELDKPLHWIKPRMIFVCSMGDLFHEKVPFGFIDRIYQAMRQCPQHTFQILTKRPEVLYEYCEIKQRGTWPKNIWLGTSISTQEDADKNIPILLQIPAAVRFISIEPLLSKIDFNSIVRCPACNGFGYYDNSEKLCPVCITDPMTKGMAGGKVTLKWLLKKIHWIILGCESGPKRRPCKIEWVRNLVQQCKAAGVPVFVKQLNINGKVCHDITKFPKDLQIREFPK